MIKIAIILECGKSRNPFTRNITLILYFFYFNKVTTRLVCRIEKNRFYFLLNFAGWAACHFSSFKVFLFYFTKVIGKVFSKETNMATTLAALGKIILTHLYNCSSRHASTCLILSVSGDLLFKAIREIMNVIYKVDFEKVATNSQLDFKKKKFAIFITFRIKERYIYERFEIH